MLAIRFLRSGRKNRAFFRIVVTENSRPPKSNYIKELGWFDPHSKQTSLKTEEILKYLDNGAKPSNSVAKLLLDNKVKHKQIVYTPDTPKEKKGKKDEQKTPAPAALKTEEVKDENDAVEEDGEAEKAETETEEAKKEEAPETEPETPKTEEKSEEPEAKVEAETEPEKES